MYLSCLLIDVGDNPDRPRPGRLWLRNLYRVHQRLCMAFPTPIQKERDPEFLMPYQPCGFEDPRPERCSVDPQQPPAQRPCATSDVERPIHVARDAEHNFLFRVDPLSGGRAAILVQSAIEPKWDYAFHNAGYLMACAPQVKQVDPHFEAGASLRFRLVANPTKRLRTGSKERDGSPVKEESVGKRVPVPTEHLYEWLARRAESAGFVIVKDATTARPGYIYFSKPENRREDKSESKAKDEAEDKRNDKGQRLRSVRYDGILRVTDPALFRSTLMHGIGPGKAFGFGLLSVAPVGTAP